MPDPADVPVEPVGAAGGEPPSTSIAVRARTVSSAPPMPPSSRRPDVQVGVHAGTERRRLGAEVRGPGASPTAGRGAARSRSPRPAGRDNRAAPRRPCPLAASSPWHRGPSRAATTRSRASRSAHPARRPRAGAPAPPSSTGRSRSRLGQGSSTPPRRPFGTVPRRVPVENVPLADHQPPQASAAEVDREPGVPWTGAPRSDRTGGHGLACGMGPPDGRGWRHSTTGGRRGGRRSGRDSLSRPMGPPGQATRRSARGRRRTGRGPRRHEPGEAGASPGRPTRPAPFRACGRRVRPHPRPHGCTSRRNTEAPGRADAVDLLEEAGRGTDVATARVGHPPQVAGVPSSTSCAASPSWVAVRSS